MKFAIIVFPGSNCDHDAYKVIENIDGATPEFVWHKENDLSKFDSIIVPGGFSYGDYLRAGAIAKFSPIMNAIVAASKAGKKYNRYMQWISNFNRGWFTTWSIN